MKDMKQEIDRIVNWLDEKLASFEIDKIWLTDGGSKGGPEAWSHFLVVSNEFATPKILVCPSDAANWDSTAFSPRTGLHYFIALEECVGKPTGYPDQTGQRFLRAVNIETGEIVWEVPQPGPARAKTWSGVLATAGGLIFYGQPNGGFTVADQRTGKTLWHFPTNVRMKASPMTFAFGGMQYVAVAAGPNILCFGL